jgi:hypothetical protein
MAFEAACTVEAFSGCRSKIILKLYLNHLRINSTTAKILRLANLDFTILSFASIVHRACSKVQSTSVNVIELRWGNITVNSRALSLHTSGYKICKLLKQILT